MKTQPLSRTLNFFVRVISIVFVLTQRDVLNDIEKDERFSGKQAASSITTNEPDRLKGVNEAIYVHSDGTIRILKRKEGGGWAETKADDAYPINIGTILLVKTKKPPTEPAQAGSNKSSLNRPGNSDIFRGRHRSSVVLTEASLTSFEALG